jgi:hypothetical protein
VIPALRGEAATAASVAAAIGTLLRGLVPLAIALLVTGCVPIGVRVQNMLALWQG